MKKYMDIERLKPSFAEGFEPNDLVYVQEKIDGANFSIRYDALTNSVLSFSRKRQLDFSNNLRGAFEWTQKLDVEKIKYWLGNKWVLFGEWLVKHTVEYPQDKYQNAYFYDIYDVVEQRYMEQAVVRRICQELGLNYVPVFYVGDFKSWDNIMQYVGQTQMGGEYGEGIVVKNQSKLNSPNTRLPFYTKIVTERFCEIKGHKGEKTIDPSELKAKEELQNLVSTIVTEARVVKILNKFVDEGLIPETWDEHDMAVIAKNMGKEVYYDCVKEEPETVEMVGEKFGHYSNSTAMRIVKTILSQRSNL